MRNKGVDGRYYFESFRFDAGSGELSNSGRSLKLRPQVSLALELLVSRRGELVTREEFRDALWPDERIVMFESSIAAVMRELRRALGDNPKSPRFIETIPKRGYRFVPAAANAPAKAASPAQPARIAGSRQGRFRGTAGGFLNLSQGLAIAMIVLLPGAVERMPPLAQGPRAEPVSVAVLPFENLSALSPQSALAEALPRDIVGRLGPVAPEGLRVIDRTGTSESGGTSADFVLRGSVRAAGEGSAEAVVSARLLAGANGAFVWGEDFRRLPQEVNLTAGELSARVAGSVLSSTLPGWSNGYEPSLTTSEAAEHYRRGLAAVDRFEPQANAEAIDAFEQALRLDPAFDAAHARLAETLTHWVGPVVTADRLERARQAALRAIELEPRNAIAHRVLGEIGLFFDRDWQLAGRRLERSVELAPAAAPGHHSYAAWLSSRGRHDEALREIDLAEALDPASVAVSIDVMLLHYYARDFEGTIAAARRLRQLWPESHSSYRFTVLSQLAMGDTAAAASEARAALAGRKPTPAESRSAVALTDSEALEAYWKASLEAVKRYVEENDGDPTFLSLLYVQLGQQDAAVDALEEALAKQRFSYFLPFLGVSPAYDSLCGHRRFERILRDLHQSALNSESVDSRCAGAMQAAARHPARTRR